MVHGVACQFFGCLVNASEFSDLWVVKAMARYVTSLYIEITFGLSEYVFQINHLMELVCDYEDEIGPITLRHRDESTHLDLHFDPTCQHTCPSSYAEMLYRKGQIIMRILELRLGREQFLKVLLVTSPKVTFVSGATANCSRCLGMWSTPGQAN